MAKMTFQAILAGKLDPVVLGSLSCEYLQYTRCGPYFGTTFEERCSASCIKPNETIELAKKRKNILCLGGGGEREFLYVVAKLQAKPQKPRKISLSYSFAVEMAHFEMVRWKYDSDCIFSMLRDTLELILWKKADKKCKDKKRRIFFAKGALIGKSICQTQRINAVPGRCFSSGVLGDIPSDFTRSVRRRILL